MCIAIINLITVLFFVPFSSEELAIKESDNLLYKRYNSDMVLSLNGKWDFCYFCKDEDIKKTFDTNKISFDKIDVPSCWQCYKYEPPFYVNYKYQFNVDKIGKISSNKIEGEYKPSIDGEIYKCDKYQYNSVGVYRTKFIIESLEKNYIISFLGVASNIELYINGKYVGYSEGSHNTAEFEINNFITNGENELLCVVHKWCTGSYLEDQDMFRYNGIFRDVLLFATNKTYIFDYSFNYIKNSDFYSASLQLNIKNFNNVSVKVSIIDGKNQIALKQVLAEKNTKVLLEKLSVTEWNAEQPKLYKLIITLIKDNKEIESICQNIGFKTIKTEGNKFYFNDKLIKLLGVNHHDLHPKTGFYLSQKDIEKDILLCKEYNINCIRTSHYPPDPLLIELASYYGIYIIDEADIETHGTRERKDNPSKNKKWKNHFWDRVNALYQRDKNSPCITMWSLGNESHGIICQDYCYEMLKKLTNIPIHYESAGFCPTRNAYDVASAMYSGVLDLEMLCSEQKIIGREHFSKEVYNKPFFLCEFCHSMGVSPGNLEEYMQMFYSNENLLGGCIWEMVSEAVFHEKDKPYKYTYGGDHGEYVHDGNFCVDGMFNPDRTPSTSAFNVKNCFRPLRAKYLGDNKIEIHNYLAFKNANYLTIKGKVMVNGVCKFEFIVPSNINAGESLVYKIDYVFTCEDTAIDIDYFDGEYNVGFDQILICEHLTDISVKSFENEIFAQKVKDNLIVKFADGEIVFDTIKGTLLSYKLNEKEILATKKLLENNGGLLFNVLRAPTDNDRKLKESWFNIGYDKLFLESKTFNYEINGNSVYILSEKVASFNGEVLFNYTDKITISNSGIVGVESKVLPTKKDIPWMPRIGKILQIDKCFDNVSYYGYGERECYIDISSQSRLGKYSSIIDDLETYYIRPQENGNHIGVRYVSFTDKNREGITILADSKPLCFTARRYSVVDLLSWGNGHNEDIKKGDSNFITIDGFFGGIGNQSCGTYPLEKYRLFPDKEYSFSFKIIPQNIIEKI